MKYLFLFLIIASCTASSISPCWTPTDVAENFFITKNSNTGEININYNHYLPNAITSIGCDETFTDSNGIIYYYNHNYNFQ